MHSTKLKFAENLANFRRIFWERRIKALLLLRWRNEIRQKKNKGVKVTEVVCRRVGYIRGILAQINSLRSFITLYYMLRETTTVSVYPLEVFIPLTILYGFINTCDDGYFWCDFHVSKMINKQRTYFNYEIIKKQVFQAGISVKVFHDLWFLDEIFHCFYVNFFCVSDKNFWEFSCVLKTAWLL